MNYNCSACAGPLILDSSRRLGVCSTCRNGLIEKVKADTHPLATLAEKLGTLSKSKQEQYGDSVGKSPSILQALYPNGIQPHQYADVLLIARVVDKLGRLAQRKADGKDLGGESPWMDIAGYGLLGWKKDETK